MRCELLGCRCEHGEQMLIIGLRKIANYGELVQENLIRKIREYSDVFYPWGRQIDAYTSG